jgi:ectoine hydroxylase-related dioxygenase (phytanoyl-CoA dioxygenase family)
LWVSIDRVALKPPVRPDQPGYDQPGFIHWDTDINKYPDIPFQLQGVLALEDTSADMGGFQCVPSIYRGQQRFLDERSKAGPVPRAPDIGDHPIVKVPLAAGDLVIWKTTLLHGNGRNSSQRPRLAQYLAMNPLPPAGEQRETVRRSRIMSWSTCAPPDGDAFPGDPRRIEEQRGEPASLGPRGRRLLGLDEWARAPGTP